LSLADRDSYLDKFIIGKTDKRTDDTMIACPKAVQDYNKYMTGIDRADMYCSQKSKKVVAPHSAQPFYQTEFGR